MAQVRITANYYCYSKLKCLHYGLDYISKLPETVRQLGASRALILTVKSVSKSPIFKDTSKALRPFHVTNFTDIGQHTPVAGIKAALEILKEKDADITIALGSGSPVDAAKAISYCSNQPTGQRFLKIIAIPKTLSAAVMFTVAINDPELVPDATDHEPVNPLVAFPTIESALASIPQLFENLFKLHADSNDLEVRQRLLNSAYLSLSPNPKPEALGLNHSLGHRLGTTHQIPHGITSCLNLAKSAALKALFSDPYSQENLTRTVKRLKAEVGDILPNVTAENEPEPSRGGAILSQYIEDLVKRLGLSSTLAEWEVPNSDLQGIAELVEKGGLAGAEGQTSVGQVYELLDSI